MFRIRPANGTFARLVESLLVGWFKKLSSSWNDTKIESCQALQTSKTSQNSHSPVLRSIALVLVTSGFGAAISTAFGVSSFSESLPPELNIETSVSIPIWSHPSTDLDLVVSCFAFELVFGGCCRTFVDFLASNSSRSSSGESSISSLFSVKLTLVQEEFDSIKAKMDEGWSN